MRSIALPAARRRAAHRPDDAEASRDPRRIGGRPRRIAARRARSHRDVDRQPAAAVVAAAPARRARADPRSARRRRGAGVPHHRARQVPRRDQGRAGSRAAGGARGARHRRAARSGRSEAVARRSFPRVRTVLADLQAPLVRSLVAELDDLRDVRDRDRVDARRRAAGARRATAASPATASTASSTSCGRSAGRASRSSPRWKSASASRTGIGSLKVRYNRVFGYYIEISKSNLHAVPADYHRKQTIAGGERYITPALKEYEEKVLGADERILERELEIFERAADRRRRRSAAHPGDRARAGHARRARRRWPRTPPSTTTSSRTCTTATS